MCLSLCSDEKNVFLVYHQMYHALLQEQILLNLNNSENLQYYLDTFPNDVILHTYKFWRYTVSTPFVEK